MITLPSGLNNFMRGQDLAGLKPFALLYRNKWDSVNNKFKLEDTPIDISDLISKPNTLSMTLDVNEVAQYNANNVTLTLSDTKNYFVEGTPNSYFPEGYQIYGSRVVLYYGTDGLNRTPLFTGVIKELPTHKPENYQVDVKLVSPLEMLKDIEAKDFSDKVTGETLTYKSTDSDGHRIYWTTGTGVGGFDAVYANGTKIFEGVDYETDQLNALGLPAIVKIINSDLYSSTITADYYTWKTGLTVEQIVAGLVGLAGYDSVTENIQPVSWNTDVRTPSVFTNMVIGIGFQKNGSTYNFNWMNTNGAWNSYNASGGTSRTNIINSNFQVSFTAYGEGRGIYSEDDRAYYQFGPIRIRLIEHVDIRSYVDFEVLYNGNRIYIGNFLRYYITRNFIIKKVGNTLSVFVDGSQVLSTTDTSVFSTETFYARDIDYYIYNQVFNILDGNGNIFLRDITSPALVSQVLDKTTSGDIWGAITANISSGGTYRVTAYFSNDGINFDSGTVVDLNTQMARTERYMRYVFEITSSYPNGYDIENPSTYYLATSIFLQIVNLSGRTVLESLQDFALISGYEFGVDRRGVFFFRPRESTTPVYVLDHSEIVKVDTVKKNLSNFFTKLTLTFAQIPLEFYANTGERPTPVDRYGIINKEIDKPDIVNYDNPELAQAIGPQLLEVYSAMPNIIQVVGKLNFALELGDIVSLRRNMNLITPEEYTDYSKYEDLNTYYRACKITGLNYNFSKKQVTYTLRDVSNKNTEPMYELEQFVYELPIKLGVKK